MYIQVSCMVSGPVFFNLFYWTIRLLKKKNNIFFHISEVEEYKH